MLVEIAGPLAWGVLLETARPFDSGRVRNSVIGGKYKLAYFPLSVFVVMGHDKLNTLQW